MSKHLSLEMHGYHLEIEVYVIKHVYEKPTIVHNITQYNLLSHMWNKTPLHDHQLLHFDKFQL